MNLPALLSKIVFFGDKSHQPDVVWEHKNKKPTFTIGDQIRHAKGRSIQAWHYVKQVSNQYCRAMGMSWRDIESLEDLGGYVLVRLISSQEVRLLPENTRDSEDGHPKEQMLLPCLITEVLLIPQNTCGAPYGGSWEYLLQPRIPNSKLPSFGGGTTYIAALPPEINEEIIKAIKAGRATVKQGSIWS